MRDTIGDNPAFILYLRARVVSRMNGAARIYGRRVRKRGVEMSQALAQLTIIIMHTAH